MAVRAEEHALARLRSLPGQRPGMTGDLELLRPRIEMMELECPVASRISAKHASPTCLLHQYPLQRSPPFGDGLCAALATPKPVIRSRAESRVAMPGAFKVSSARSFGTSSFRFPKVWAIARS